jgi:hypothetical protein
MLGRVIGGDVEWIHLPQDRNRWRALVSVVTKLCVRDHGDVQLVAWLHFNRIVFTSCTSKRTNFDT